MDARPEAKHDFGRTSCRVTVDLSEEVMQCEKWQ